MGFFENLRLKVELVIKLIAVTYSVVMAFIFIVIFMKAWMSEEKAIIVDINKYGEATVEFYWLLVSIPLIIVGYILFLKELVDWYIRKRRDEIFKTISNSLGKDEYRCPYCDEVLFNQLMDLFQLMNREAKV